MHSQYQHDNTIKQGMPRLLYTKTGYITVLCVSYNDNWNCKPAKFKFVYHLYGQNYNNTSLLKKYVNKIIQVIRTNLADT